MGKTRVECNDWWFFIHLSKASDSEKLSLWYFDKSWNSIKSCKKQDQFHNKKCPQISTNYLLLFRASSSQYLSDFQSCKKLLNENINFFMCLTLWKINLLLLSFKGVLIILFEQKMKSLKWSHWSERLKWSVIT